MELQLSLVPQPPARAATGHIPGGFERFLLPWDMAVFFSTEAGGFLSQALAVNGYSLYHHVYDTTAPAKLLLSVGKDCAALQLVLSGGMKVAGGHVRAGQARCMVFSKDAGHSREIFTESGTSISLFLLFPKRLFMRMLACYLPAGEPPEGESPGDVAVRLLTKRQRLGKASLLAIDEILGCRTEGVVRYLYLHQRVTFLLGQLLERATASLVRQGWDMRQGMLIKDLEDFIYASLPGYESRKDRFLNVPSLAGRYGMAQHHFKRAVRFHYGIPYSSLLLRCRMAVAMRLLKVPGPTYRQIAWETGYTDENNFVRAFTSYYGYSPSNVTGETDGDNAGRQND
jgi:AraC-like DNA-binding protein